MPVTETFNEACVALSEFLRGNGRASSELLWLCREDVTGERRRIFVHPSPPSINRNLYAAHYEFGVQNGRGIGVVVSFFLGEKACCYVQVARDDLDAEYAMLSGGLRLSIPDGESEFPITATQCGTAVGFYLRRGLSRLCRESAVLAEIPNRRALGGNARNP